MLFKKNFNGSDRASSSALMAGKQYWQVDWNAELRLAP